MLNTHLWWKCESGWRRALSKGSFEAIRRLGCPTHVGPFPPGPLSRVPPPMFASRGPAAAGPTRVDPVTGGPKRSPGDPREYGSSVALAVRRDAAASDDE